MVLARGRFWGLSLLNGLVLMPLILPPVVTGYILLILFGRRGPIGAFLADHLGIVFSFRWTGAALACGVMGFPLLVRAIRLSVEAVDARLEEAAGTLGANRAWVFATVTLPLIVPGIIAGMILCFAKAMGEFGATMARLGPDALGASFDRAEAVRRLRTQSSLPVGDALLNQRLLAGVGNVLKSEVLFSCGINPFVSIATLDDHQLKDVVDTSRRLLQANVAVSKTGLNSQAGHRRTTGRDNPSERLWVYGRARLPCRRCGTPIEVRKHGPDAARRLSWEDARLTYWCPACQTS